MDKCTTQECVFFVEEFIKSKSLIDVQHTFKQQIGDSKMEEDLFYSEENIIL